MTIASEEEGGDPPLVVVGVSVKYVMSAYGISKSTVYDLLDKGVFKAKSSGERTLICLPSVVAWFRNLPDYKSGRRTTEKATHASVRKRSERAKKKKPEQPE